MNNIYSLGSAGGIVTDTSWVLPPINEVCYTDNQIEEVLETPHNEIDVYIRDKEYGN